MLALPAQSSAPATFTSTGFAELFQRNCGAGRTVFKQQSVSGKTGDITVGDRNWFSQDEMSTFSGVTPALWVAPLQYLGFWLCEFNKAAKEGAIPVTRFWTSSAVSGRRQLSISASPTHPPTYSSRELRFIQGTGHFYLILKWNACFKSCPLQAALGIGSCLTHTPGHCQQIFNATWDTLLIKNVFAFVSCSHPCPNLPDGKFFSPGSRSHSHL